MKDSRIRVLDLPKSGGRGYRNRHIAITHARGEVIFYIDEDDLWFPDHAEKLLAALRGSSSDVACSTVASVAANGEIQIAIFDHSQGPLRDLLASREWRSIFKIHLCHTRRSYLSLGKGWSETPDDESVFSLLSSLAAPSFKWVSIPDVTALSFHGSPRRSAGLSDEERTIEVAKMSKQVQTSEMNGASVLHRASISHYLFSLFWRVTPNTNDNLDQYLNSIRSHFKSSGAPIHPETEGHSEIRLSKKQTADATALLDWWNRRAIHPMKAFRLALALSQIVNGPPIFNPASAMRFALTATFRPAYIYLRKVFSKTLGKVIMRNPSSPHSRRAKKTLP